MKKEFGVKPFIFPQPVLILATYDENGNPNAMNAAWGGIADDNEIMVCLSSHKTTDNLKIHQACTIGIGDAENVIPCDYVGIVTGRKEDKIKKAGWTVTKSTYVNAPIINELPISMSCTLLKVIDGCKYLFRIEQVHVDERILTNGEIDFDKFHPISFDTAHYGYYELGRKVGQAFSEGKKIQ